MKRNQNIIGNPKRKNFSFGYIRFIGEFGLIDLGITLIIACLIVINFIFSTFLVALILSIFYLLIGFLLIKQWGNEKSYDYLIAWLKYRSSYKKVNKFKYEEFPEEWYEVKNGFDIDILSSEEINLLIEKFNSFIKLYEGAWKIVKINQGFDLSNNIDYLNSKKPFETNKSKIINKYLLKEMFLKTNQWNPQVFLVFYNPNPNQKNLIGNISFLTLNKLENEKISLLKGTFLKENIVIKNNSILSNDKKLVISQAKFKKTVNNYWLNYLFSDSKSSFVLEINTPKLNERNKLIRKLNKTRINSKTNNDIERKELEIVNQANEIILEDIIIQNEELKLIDFTVIYQIEENQIDGEVQFKNLNLTNFFSSNFKLVKNYFKQFETLKLSLNNWNNAIYPTTNKSIASSFPFLNQTFIDEEGSLIGFISDRYPFIYDTRSLKNKTNWHTIIIGSTGSGKTTLLKYLLMSEISLDKGKQLIIDPHNEFGNLSKSFNGMVFNLSKLSFNPLKLTVNNNENLNDVIENKIFSIKEFFKLIYKDELDTSFFQLIQLFLIELELFYFSHQFEILNGKEFIFSDLKFDKKYDLILKPIIEGIYKKFNRKENFNFNNDLIIFQAKELFSLKSDLKDIIIFLLMNRINEYIYSNQTKQEKINLVIDEAGKFLRNEFLIQTLSPLFSDARKFNTKLTIVTQNLVDLYGDNLNINLANIFSNSSNMFIGNLKNDQRKLLNDFLSIGKWNILTKNENLHIDKGRGHFLYLNDNARHLFLLDYDLDLLKLS